MRLNLRRIADNMRRAETEDLLDRVTVYRADMEPAALDLILGELDRRGVTEEDIAAHDAGRRETAIFAADGSPVRCSFCDRPAVGRAWGWYRIFFGRLPVFPRVFPRCGEHGATAT